MAASSRNLPNARHRALTTNLDAALKNPDTPVLDATTAARQVAAQGDRRRQGHLL
jgi:hypothetical protein